MGSVLFVDDQIDITELIKRILKDEDYVQHYANSAIEALEILQNSHIDVIVTDMVMPDISGLQLLSMVREKYPETVRVVLSGQLQMASVLAAINSGEVYRYITKPWRLDTEARSVIKDALGYAEFRRLKNSTSNDSGFMQINLDTLYQIMEHIGKPSFLMHNGSISKAGCGEKENNMVDLTRYQTIEICNNCTLYIEK